MTWKLTELSSLLVWFPNQKQIGPFAICFLLSFWHEKLFQPYSVIKVTTEVKKNFHQVLIEITKILWPVLALNTFLAIGTLNMHVLLHLYNKFIYEPNIHNTWHPCRVTPLSCGSVWVLRLSLTAWNHLLKNVTTICNQKYPAGLVRLGRFWVKPLSRCNECESCVLTCLNEPHQRGKRIRVKFTRTKHCYTVCKSTQNVHYLDSFHNCFSEHNSLYGQAYSMWKPDTHTHMSLLSVPLQI